MIMGIGPVPASEIAISKAGLSWNDIDLIELNEAFAAQSLAVIKALNLDQKKINVNGGAIAFGHPLGASGARILYSLALELKEKQARYGLASLLAAVKEFPLSLKEYKIFYILRTNR